MYQNYAFFKGGAIGATTNTGINVAGNRNIGKFGTYEVISTVTGDNTGSNIEGDANNVFVNSGKVHNLAGGAAGKFLRKS